MNSKKNADRQKLINEKLQAILSSLLKEEDNKYCVDCDAKGPRWASWNLGIFLCIRCAGIHRNLGVHLSRVKSVNLDSWTPDQVAMMQEVGNSKARAVYEAHLPDGYRRPQTDSALEAFIRCKYESKKYIAKEWTPPTPTLKIETLLGDERKKKSKFSSGIKLPPSGEQRVKKTVDVTQSDETVSRPAVPVAPQQPTAVSADLLGLESPAASTITTSNSGTADLLGDLLNSAPTPSTVQAQSTQNDFFGVSSAPTNSLHSTQNDFLNVSSALTNASQSTNQTAKDSIMALFSGSSGAPQQPSGWNAVPGMMPGHTGVRPSVQPAVQPGWQQLPPGGAPMMQQTYGAQQRMQMNAYQPVPQQSLQNMQMNRASFNGVGVHMSYSNTQHQQQVQTAQQQMASMGLQSTGNPGAGHTLSNSLWQ